VTPCPHPGIQVEDRCYCCLKVAATNGHRSKLSTEQLAFVGFVTEGVLDTSPTAGTRAWLQPTTPSTIDKQLEELERLRDLAPNWLALARRILDDDGEKS
jgi:hypothetical protein